MSIEYNNSVECGAGSEVVGAKPSTEGPGWVSVADMLTMSGPHQRRDINERTSPDQHFVQLGSSNIAFTIKFWVKHGRTTLFQNYICHKLRLSLPPLSASPLPSIVESQ